MSFPSDKDPPQDSLLLQPNSGEQPSSGEPSGGEQPSRNAAGLVIDNAGSMISSEFSFSRPIASQEPQTTAPVTNTQIADGLFGPRSPRTSVQSIQNIQQPSDIPNVTGRQVADGLFGPRSPRISTQSVQESSNVQSQEPTSPRLRRLSQISPVAERASRKPTLHTFNREKENSVSIPAPTDRSGISADAQFWKNYVDEASSWDKENLARWNQTMDVLLVFAALFSAILTAFIIEFYHLLQQDTQQLTVTLLQDLVLLLQNQNTSAIQIPSQQFSPSQSTLWVNALWFTSLTLSLGTAMAAILAKQWLQSYVQNLQNGTAKQYALRRQLRYNALLHWQVPTIISFLPVILQLAVILFVAGLVIVLWQINRTIATLVLALVATLLLLYGMSVVLPLLYSECPYKTSASVYLEWILVWTARIALQVRQKTGPLLPTSDLIGFPLESGKREILHLHQRASDLCHDSIVWLFDTSQKKEIQDSALAAIADAEHNETMVVKLRDQNILAHLEDCSMVDLPGREESFWKSVEDVEPSHKFIQDLVARTPYLLSLISVWQHRSFLYEDAPPAISEMRSRQTSHSWLLKDWLLLWRHLRKQDGARAKALRADSRIMSSFATVVSAEVFYYHLQVRPRSLPNLHGRHSSSFNLDEPNPFYDLYDMLESLMSEQNSEDETVVLLLLETLMFILAKIQVSSASEVKQELLLLLIIALTKPFTSSVKKDIYWTLATCLRLLMHTTSEVSKTTIINNRKNFSQPLLAAILSQVVHEQIPVTAEQPHTATHVVRSRSIVQHASEELYRLLICCTTSISPELGCNTLINLPVSFVEKLVLLATRPQTWSHRKQMENYTMLLTGWYTQCFELTSNDKKRIIFCVYDLIKAKGSCTYIHHTEKLALGFLLANMDRDMCATDALGEILREALRKGDSNLISRFESLDGISRIRALLKPMAGTELSERQVTVQKYWSSFQYWQVHYYLGKHPLSIYSRSKWNIVMVILSNVLQEAGGLGGPNRPGDPRSGGTKSSGNGEGTKLGSAMLKVAQDFTCLLGFGGGTCLFARLGLSMRIFFHALDE